MDADRTLQALLRFVGEIASAEPPAEAGAAALDAAAAALDAPRAWVQRHDADGLPRIVLSRGASPACHAAAEGGLPWTPEPPAPGIVVVDAAPGVPGMLPEALRAEGLRAAMFVPMVAGGRLLGALVLLTESSREWTAGERRVAEGLARLAAGAFERERERSTRDRLARELLRAQRLRSVGRLAGSVAHDFNNVLTAMIGYMDLVSTDLPPGTEEQGYLAQALEAAEQATDLSRQLLAFARRPSEPRTPQNLNALLDRLVPLVRRLVPESVHLAALAHADPAWVLADPGEVEQVVVNLALLARDAMPGGGVLTLSTRNVGGDGDPDGVAFEVADTGEGMDDAALRRALEPLEAASEDGRGLELAIAAALVRASGGRMAAARDPAGGTRVRASWPLAVPQGARPEPGGVVAGGRETVLFVDDDTAVRDLAVATLSRLGYEVLTATGADEALRWLGQNPGGARLLVADLVLPGMSGPELVLRARETRPDLRALLTSGYAASPCATEVAGGLAFLAKPFTGESLARRVRETLDAPPAGVRVAAS